MEHIGMKLTEEHVRWAAPGGSILGGGGGGSAKTELSSEIWLCGSASWN